MVPEPYNKLYNPADIILPTTIEEDLSSKPASQSVHHAMWGMGCTTQQQLREITALYYAHITFIDEQIGRVLAVMDEQGLTDNTIIAFSSDHGELLGNHGLVYKGKMYNESLRIPLLIHDASDTASQTAQGLVSQIDIMPTILDLAGIPLPDWSQGRSMRTLMQGDASCARQEVFAEIKQIAGSNAAPGYITGCRTNDFLFSYEINHHSGTCEGELYSVKDDPRQINNLYRDPAHAERVAHFKEQILNWFLATQ